MSKCTPWLPLPQAPRIGGLGVLLLSLGLHGLLLKLPIPPAPAPPSVAGLESGLARPRSTGVAIVNLPSAAPIPPPPVQEQPHPRPPSAPALPSPPVAPEPVDADPALQPPADLTYNHQARTLTTNTEDFLDWYGQQDWGDFDLPPLPGRETLAPLMLSYSLEVCLNPPPAPGRLEVIVDANGALVRSPRLLASTGYDRLDREALEQASQTPFSQLQTNRLAQPRVYWLALEVQYNPQSCISSLPQGEG